MGLGLGLGFLLAGILAKPAILQYLELVLAEEMIAEAPGEFPQASALVFPLIIIQSNIHPGQQGFSSMSELPLHQLLRSHRGSVLLQPRQDGVRGLGLDSIEHP